MSNQKRPTGAPENVKMQYEGLPYHGQSLDYKNSDPEEKLPQLRYKAQVKVLELGDPEDLKEYEKVVQKLVSDTAVLSYELKEYDQDKKNWKILIVYSEVFYTNPDPE